MMIVGLDVHRHVCFGNVMDEKRRVTKQIWNYVKYSWGITFLFLFSLKRGCYGAYLHEKRLGSTGIG